MKTMVRYGSVNDLVNELMEIKEEKNIINLLTPIAIIIK